jgi:hypothetical protein
MDPTYVLQKKRFMNKESFNMPSGQKLVTEYTAPKTDRTTIEKAFS